METLSKSVMTILSSSIKIGQSNFSVLDFILILVTLVLISFIYLRLFSNEKKAVKKESKKETMKKKTPFNVTFEQVQSIKTINIYWNKVMNKDLYHVLISSLELWLVHELHFYDITTLDGLSNQYDSLPVIAISPVHRVFVIHNNQEEERKNNTISLELSTNDLGYIKDCILSHINLLGGSVECR